jgi:peptide/nickel transport system ATP-binding protein
MTILKAINVSKTYGKKGQGVKALDDISFSLEKGEALGIVGESGCGKSTLAKAICSLETIDSGTLEVAGVTLPAKRAMQRRCLYRKAQMVFQNPVDSFDPRMRLKKSITEAARNFGMSAREADRCLSETLDRVGLPADYAYRRPHQISGGECQRAAIARALLVRPEILICDEVTSALDVSVQAQILSLLHDVRKEYAMSLLFISHDLAVVQSLCSRIAVMYRGRIVEMGSVGQIINSPRHQYTKLLLNSTLSVNGFQGIGA